MDSESGPKAGMKTSTPHPQQVPDKSESAHRCAQSIIGYLEGIEKNKASALDEEARYELSKLAGTVAGLLHVLPLDKAEELYKERLAFHRAIETFRGAYDTYVRRTQDYVPSPTDVLYLCAEKSLTDAVIRNLPRLDLEDYLSEISNRLHDDESGMWVHPMLATPKGQWPRNPNAAAENWIIRALDNYGVPRNTDTEKDAFLELSVGLAKIVNEHCPGGVEVTSDRKSFQAKLDSIQDMRWKGRTA